MNILIFFKKRGNPLVRYKSRLLISSFRIDGNLPIEKKYASARVAIERREIDNIGRHI